MQREHAQEAENVLSGTHEARATTACLPSASCVIADALRMMQHVPAPAQVIQREERLLCGRWIAWQRAQQARSNAWVRQVLDVGAETMLHLELGILETGLPDVALMRLCDALAGKGGDADFVLAVAQVALGQRTATEPLMERVIHDLATTADREVD